MDQVALKNFEEKGLPCPFIILQSGVIVVSQTGETIKNELTQMATIIFETINAIGHIKIDTIEIVGDKKGAIITVDDERLLGCLFEWTEDLSLDKLYALLGELKDQSGVAPTAKEKVMVKLTGEVLEEIKAILKEYLGDFAERIYQNQIKTQRIKTDEFYEEDARRFILALGKAAGMIIGPSKGSELTNKLYKILK